MEGEEFLELSATVQEKIKQFHACTRDRNLYVSDSFEKMEEKKRTLAILENMVERCRADFYSTKEKRTMDKIVSNEHRGSKTDTISPVCADESISLPVMNHSQTESLTEHRRGSTSVQKYTAAEERRRAEAVMMKKTLELIELCKIRHKMRYVSWRLEELCPRKKTRDELVQEEVETFMKTVRQEKKKGTLMEFAMKSMRSSSRYVIN